LIERVFKISLKTYLHASNFVALFTACLHASNIHRMKNRILDLATQQLLMGGYDKLNFAKIADKLNTTRANLHYHFKNKENLAKKVFVRYESGTIALYSDLRDQFKGDYVGFFKEIESTFWDEPYLNREGGRYIIIEIVSDADLPEPIAKMCRELYGNIQEIIRTVIQDGVDSHQIKKKIDVNREATRALVIMVGMFTSGHYFRSNDKAKEMLNSLLLDWANSLKRPAK